MKCVCFLSGLPLLWMHSNGPRLIEAFRYDHWAIGAVQTGDFYQIETMVCPVQVSCVEERKNRQDLLIPGSATERAWTWMHERKCNISWARTSNPVDGDAFHPADAGGDDVLPPRLITFGPRNLVQSHVCPVHSLIGCQREKKKNLICSHHSPETNTISSKHVFTAPFHQMCSRVLKMTA